jgi:hypothetical protein
MGSGPPDHDGAALLVLEEQLRREQQRIEERRSELEASRELLARLTSRSLGAHEPLIEPVSPALAPSVVGRLLAETTGVIRSLVLTVEEGPALDDTTMRASEERLRRGDQQRSIYPASALATPHGKRWLSSWAEAGEDQRVVPATETEFAVFGETAAVALAGWDDLDSGYVVIRDPLVVRLYSAYFDLTWRLAAPVPTGRDRTADTKLVELLELGMKDEAIARYLGVSLRTVRRRVAGLMSVNGVDTRFQLGWVLARRRR